jgi:hypothetical protein
LHGAGATATFGDMSALPALIAGLEHDLEKGKPVFRKDHAQTKS